MKTFLLAATYLVGIGELILALYFWLTNSKNEIRRVMALVSFFVGIWVLSIASTVAFPDIFHRGLMLDITYLFGSLLTTAVLLLTFVFPYRNTQLNIWHAVFLFVPSFIFSLMLFWSDAIVETYSMSGLSGEYKEGPIFYVFGIILTLQFITSVYLLLQRMRQATGMHRKLITMMIAGLCLGGLPAVYFNLVSPIWTGYGTFPFIGTMSTVIWLGLITYAVSKK